MPESAKNVKYYYYEGHFDEKYAVSMNVDNADHLNLNGLYDDYYSGEIEINKNCREIMYDSNLSFLVGFIENNNDEYFLKHYRENTDEYNLGKRGILLNEKENIIILFYYHHKKL